MNSFSNTWGQYLDVPEIDVNDDLAWQWFVQYIKNQLGAYLSNITGLTDNNTGFMFHYPTVNLNKPWGDSFSYQDPVLFELLQTDSKNYNWRSYWDMLKEMKNISARQAFVDNMLTLDQLPIDQIIYDILRYFYDALEEESA